MTDDFWAKQKLSQICFKVHVSIFEVDIGESTGKNGYTRGSA